MNPENLGINRYKMEAKSDQYFNLFYKNIGNINWRTCLLAYIGNETVIVKIINLNPTAQYIIFDNPIIGKILSLNGFNLTNIKFIDCEKDFNTTIGDLNMKFDKIIMNPPYSGKLHLKILEKAIEKLADDGKCINLSPCEFIIRPYMKDSWKKALQNYKNSIGQYMESLDLVSGVDFKSAFNDTQNDIMVGIYTISKNGGNFDYENFYKNFDTNYQDFMSNIASKSSLKTYITTYTNQKYFVPLRADAIMERWWKYKLINYLDIIVDGKVYSGNYQGKTIVEARAANPHENHRNDDRKTFGIAFNSLKEAINFRDSLNLEAYIYLISKLKLTRKFPLDKLPYLDNYSKSLTNEDIFDMFKINKEEREKIILNMKPYVNENKTFHYPWQKTKGKWQK